TGVLGRQQEATLRSGPRARLNFRAFIPRALGVTGSPRPCSQPPAAHDGQISPDRPATERQRPQSPAKPQPPAPNSPGSATAPARRLIEPTRGSGVGRLPVRPPALAKIPDDPFGLFVADLDEFVSKVATLPLGDHRCGHPAEVSPQGLI